MIMEKDKEEQIKMIAEINGQMKESFEEWADILLKADTMEWSFFLDFDKRDLYSTLNIFWRVWSNHCIKNGTLTVENVEEKSRKFTEAIKECFGIDTVELTNRYIENAQKEE